MENNKIKAWGVRQAVWGAVIPEFYWFATKEERDKYVEEHDHLFKEHCRLVEKKYVFQTYEAWKRWNNDR